MKLVHKLFLLNATITVPLVAIAGYFVVAGVNKDIATAGLEKKGNAYQRPLNRLLEGFAEREIAILSRAAEAAGRYDSAIDRAFTELAAVHNDLKDDLQFTPEGLAQRKRSHVEPETLAREWRELKSQGSSLAPAAALAHHAHLLADVRTMIAHVGDTSGLILDPDLDSYYVMDSSVVALPQTEDRLCALVAFAWQTGTPAGSQARFIADGALLREADLAHVTGDLSTALQEDSNFYGSSESLQARIPLALREYSQATERLLVALSAGGAIQNDGRDALEAAFRLNAIANAELDRLLDTRISHFKGIRTTGIALCVLAVLFSASITLLVLKSIVRNIRHIASSLTGNAAQIADAVQQVSSASHTLAQGAAAAGLFT